MPWPYVANAVRLYEPSFAAVGVFLPLSDVWTTSGTGTASLDPGNVAGMWATSTSTIYVNDGAEWVYVFHNNCYGLETSLKQEPGDGGYHQSHHSIPLVPGRWATQLAVALPPAGLVSTTFGVDRYLQFQKAGYGTFQDGLDPTDPNPAAGLGIWEDLTGGTPFVNTSIPYRPSSQATGWNFEYIAKYMFSSSGGSSGWGLVPVLKIKAGFEFFVAFRDPTVIAVPGNTDYPWLMIVKRVRVFYDTSGAAHTAEFGNEVDDMLSAKDSISDIVAFKSNNPSFQHDGFSNFVKGPYLLVDSLASVEENQTFRTSNRVPCAVFDGDTGTPDLYVYYVVESSVRGDGDDHSFEDTFGGGVSVTQIENQQDRWAGGSYADNGRGIAVKKITYNDLQKEVLDKTVDPPDQASWTKASAVTGELLGLVRVWIPEESGGPVSWWKPVELWDARFYRDDDTTGVNYTPVKADPCALWTLEGGIRLFFACFARPGGGLGADRIKPVDGWGIWHAASIAGGARLHQSSDPMTPSARFMAIHGKDFVVRRSLTFTVRSLTIEIWPDMVAASNVYAADARKWMDPDVFILPDGLTVVMLAGCERYYEDMTGALVPYDGDPLGRFEGDMADLIWPWSNAF